MGKHYSKNELCQMIKNLKSNQKLSKTRDVCSWATWINIVCYFFYKQGWGIEDIKSYLNYQTYFYSYFEADENQWIEQRKFVDDYMGDKKFDWLDDVKFDGPSFASKNKAVNYLNSKMTDINNDYMESSYRFFLAHYRAMAENGAN